ncbi:ATP binding [Branchiostoma belcheri]|nr:ATP binding [Branchiostoma belcheri]
MPRNSKDEPVKKPQGDVKKVSKKLYQLEEVLQLTPGRFECAIPEAPLIPKFCEQVGMYMGAMLNSYGGIVRWGVSRTGLAKVKVIGTHCDRKLEDEYKVALDCVAKGFSPRIDPSLYRLDFVEILRKSTNQPFREIRVIELRVQAGQELLYMDQEQKVRVVNGSQVYGPLIPQEIKRLVLKKYRKELLDSQSLLEVITPLVGRPLPGAITPLQDRPPCGVSVDTQTSPALCHGNGVNSVTVQVTPMQSHVNKSSVACPGTPMPTLVTASKVHSATPMQTHPSKSNVCSITPMHALVGTSKVSSPIETPKQNLQTALDMSLCTPYVGKGTSNSLTGCCDSESEEPKQNLQHVLETSACTPVGNRSVSKTGDTESSENAAEKPLVETEAQTSAKLPMEQENLATEGRDGPQDTLQVQGEDVGTGKNVSEGQGVPEDAAKGAEILSGEPKEGNNVSTRRDSIGTFAHKLLEESLDAKKDPKADSEAKENESPASKEPESASGSSKTSLADRVRTFLKDVKQKITRTKENNNSKQDSGENAGSKKLKEQPYSYNQSYSGLYQASVTGRFDDNPQGRYYSNTNGVDTQGRHYSHMNARQSQDWYSANMSVGDRHHFYRLRQEAAIREAWRSSYY